MGHWTLEIKGHGIHHNRLAGDADAIGRAAVRRLQLAGSDVSAATLRLVDPEGKPFTDDDGSKYSTDLLATLDKVPELPTSEEQIIQFFTAEHLPPHLRAVSQPFADMAATIVATLPRNPERTVALRKLLEAKDAAVRAKLAK